MRFMLLAASASFVVGMAALACSSAQPAPAETNSNASKGNATENDEQGSSPEPSPLDSGGGTVEDVVTIDSGIVEDAGTLCLPTSIPESESNNDVTTADPLPAQTTTYCGRIGAGDVDFVTFTMPNQVSTFGFNIDAATSNQLRVEPSADGEPFNFNSNNYPFKPGKPYVLKLSSLGGPLDYRLKVTINP